MNKYKFLGALFFLALFCVQCDVENFGNPNGPVDTDLLSGASAADIQLMVSGLESVMRNDMGFHYTTTAIVGREWYDMSGTDPRYISELMGENGNILDFNGFLTTRAYAQVYRVARNANNLITAVQNAQAGYSDAQASGLIGIAKTYMAFSLLLEANRQFENGMRIDVADPDNIGDIVSGYQPTLTALEGMLDDAASDLAAAGDAFAVTLSPGMAGLDDPAGFLQFNRAIAARVNAYQNDNGGLMDALNASFLDMDGDLNAGAYHVFGLSGNDIQNPLVVVPGQGQFFASNSTVNDAEEGDMRLAMKNTATTDTASLQGIVLNDAWRLALYTAPTDDVPMIRNEELVLLMAEARLNAGNPGGAIDAINIVRAAAGLDAYAGATDADAVLDQLLYERRYSLYGEGHRWVDARRYSRFGELPLERAGDIIHTRFPIPETENEG